MSRLPLIVGFGGINPAGRTSGHHAFRRMVFDELEATKQDKTLLSLSHLMNMPTGDIDKPALQQAILAGTLIRPIEPNLFDSHHVYSHQLIKAAPHQSINALSFVMKRSRLPSPPPDSWSIETIDADHVRVGVDQAQDFLLPCSRDAKVHVAGQLPRGLDISAMYPSRNHPRGLQMSIFAMSDALGQLGIDWQYLKNKVAVDQVSVYAGSAFGQMDSAANGGLLSSRLLGKRPTSKHLALGMADMPANFVNSYILGNLGATGNTQGACASFLYNLRQAVYDIREGRARIVIVGASEAAITPEVIEGFATMGALVTDQGLKELSGEKIDYRRACRPFGDNRGFVLGEAAQYFVLMDDELAMECGATVYGAIGDVFVNADGYKKSISSPGVGNYLTLAKSVALAKSIVGERGIGRSLMIAHGTGTPQNRVTEAAIIRRVAQSFDLQKYNCDHEPWPVIAPKAYLGHSIGASSGDQLAVALGVWHEHVLPGIWSIDRVADDVDQQGLDFVLKSRKVAAESLDIAFINAKGFGGNNASAAIIAPHVAQRMLAQKYTAKQFNSYRQRSEKVQQACIDYEHSCLQGKAAISYLFDHNVMQDQQITTQAKRLSVENMHVNLELKNPYADMEIA